MKGFVFAVALLLASVAQAQDMAVLLNVAPSPRPAGFQVTLPDPAGGQVRLGANVDVVRATVVMPEAEKLADGKEMEWGVWISSDGGTSWRFRVGGTWRSYGPNGYFDFINNVWNPDPYIQLPAAELRRQWVRVEFKALTPLTAGVKIESQ